METLLPHPSPSEGDQNAWNQNYKYIFEIIDTDKPIINDDEINTSNVRVGFSKKKQLSMQYAGQGQSKAKKSKQNAFSHKRTMLDINLNVYLLVKKTLNLVLAVNICP